MIKEILAPVPGGAWPRQCPDPPRETYAVYFDDVTADGPDNINLIFTHDVTAELYAPTVEAADEAEAAIEAILDARGVRWTKQSKYWLKAIQRFQTIYEFTYIEKRSE